ncbi:MAG: hypothetical protein EP344_04755 [Bacteroidetes bacterium]|nr:MAG: hypothetical protein EP344_04755 [Bacteroidota bacterium]
MKHLTLLLVFVFAALQVWGQAISAPDTLLIQTFSVDPSDTFLIFPGGNDNQWVNWDADNLPTECGDGVTVPGSWFWDSDLGDTSAFPQNSAFISCSWLVDPTQPNENWLITPPVFITDTTAVLHWRSMPVQGPWFMDGYKVLVSTASNEPFTGAFTDTLFVAAEMLSGPNLGGLNLNDYVFSPGYIHADQYTDTDYFFRDPPNAPFYTGRLEPHTVSLAEYASQRIYIAFLHDSTNDFLLEIDDIAVLQGETSATRRLVDLDAHLKAGPNPCRETVWISWEFPTRLQGQLTLTDQLGRVVLTQPVDSYGSGAQALMVGHLTAGAYACALTTAHGCQTILLVKQ